MKIIIRRGLGVGYFNNGKIFFCEEMKEFCGKTLSVTGISEDGYYKVEENRWLWSNDMIEKKISETEISMLKFQISCKNKKEQRVDSLPVDVKNVIINGKTVIVTLLNDSKGVSKCGFGDTFDPYVGFVLAYYKAKKDRNGSLKKVLDSCISSAKRKGYKQAILKNYE